MMKIRILSDLHLEFKTISIDFTDCDIVVLAGDIHIKDKAINWIQSQVKDKPVLYILGNHEYYGKAYPKLIKDLKEKTQGSNIHILENDTFSLNDINFLGCTLWTDFDLFGEPRLTGFQCQQNMSDFKKIRLSPKYSKLRSIDVASIHYRSLTWLNNELKELQGQKNVVITHHAPSIESIAEQNRADDISAAYASDLTKLIKENKPNYWIHGHLHESLSYNVGSCLVVCNPRGYPDEPNFNFDENYTIEI